MREKRISRRIVLKTLILLAVLSVAAWSIDAASPAQEAWNIIEQTGVQGGLVVHVGCGDGKLTAALRLNDRYLVHGLDNDAKNVAKARYYIQSLGQYGEITVDRMNDGCLPYVDNSVNLLVGDDLGKVPMVEVMRVLVPKGVAYIREGNEWTKKIKPRPEEMDEWTHFLYDSTNNAVSSDTLVDLPNHIQWIGEPKTARSHDHLCSISAVVSTGGRIFYIADEGPTESLALSPRWTLTRRDTTTNLIC